MHDSNLQLEFGLWRQSLGPHRLSDFAAKRLYRTAQGFSPGLCVARIRPESISNPASAGCNLGRAYRHRFRREYLPTNPLEDEDDDEDENDVPHKWRPSHVFRLLVCYSDSAPNTTFRAPFTVHLTQG
jgi:hypothetical protein